MMAIVIKNLKGKISNPNLLLGKKTIWFEPLVQKGKIDKQTASIF